MGLLSTLPTVTVGQSVHYHWFDDREERTLTAEDYAVILSAEGTECYRPGCVQDIVYNLDSAINAIQAGCIAVAVNPENQAALNYERMLYVDCFGE